MNILTLQVPVIYTTPLEVGNVGEGTPPVVVGGLLVGELEFLLVSPDGEVLLVE